MLSCCTCCIHLLHQLRRLQHRLHSTFSTNHRGTTRTGFTGPCQLWGRINSLLCRSQQVLLIPCSFGIHRTVSSASFSLWLPKLFSGSCHEKKPWKPFQEDGTHPGGHLWKNLCKIYQISDFMCPRWPEMHVDNEQRENDGRAEDNHGKREECGNDGHWGGGGRCDVGNLRNEWFFKILHDHNWNLRIFSCNLLYNK